MSGIETRVRRMETEVEAVSRSDVLTEADAEAIIRNLNSRWLAGEPCDAETEMAFRRIGMFDEDGNRVPFLERLLLGDES